MRGVQCSSRGEPLRTSEAVLIPGRIVFREKIRCTPDRGCVPAVQPFAQSNSRGFGVHWAPTETSIGNKDVILIGGSNHYFRIPREEWGRSLRGDAEDGFNIVDVYIPWFIHEPEENKFDFDNLQHFLDMAHKYGLYVVARPGP